MSKSNEDQTAKVSQDTIPAETPQTPKESLETETADVSEGTVKSTSPGLNPNAPKYLVLANTMFWYHKPTGFRLSWLSETKEYTLRDLDPKSLKEMAEAKKATEEENKNFDPDSGDWWIETKDIPNDPDLLKMLNRAVNVGILELTDDYRQWIIDKKTQRKAAKAQRIGLEWSEIKDEDVINRSRLPQNPSIARKTMAYADKDSKAYNLLQETANDLKSLIPKVVGALPETAREKFLTEALNIERNGYNRSATPRSTVVDVIVDLQRDYGFSSGIGIVTSQQEPITSDVKPLKIPLG